MERFILDAIEVLKAKDAVREELIKRARDLGRISRSVIINVHNNVASEELLKEAKSIVDRINDLLRIHPDLIDTVRASLQEYVEAVALSDLVEKGKLPSYIELNVDPASYLLGISDVIGELKRIAIKYLNQGMLNEATKMLSYMREIFEGLCKWDLPDALAPGLRHKVDINRRIIEDLEVTILNIKEARALINLLKTTQERLKKS